ncbi:LrgB-like family-domain-containing protein [Paecilomyces variotii]|uniref:LrgB-like family-domain-containing protein n=1 Tax=Byssochlamys spectabilis TaxID=264951 RepID=A0A443HPV6_BYSSP|nr:LrgB-like family-domain-containing protein [Paecilomyces variotii]KAJ9238070.1 hypothetical protein DTO169E5_4912 [Paecilomyces variotii]KAJ9353782.1 hypothetical protein DTO280E4_7161 [Paecilomyces variotii]RWQ93809.1 LrgB-like family-domain-containing protein [Paecilomyces variotii]
MSPKNQIESGLYDAVSAITLVVRLSWRRLLRSWIQVPVGLLLALLTCFGVDSLLGLSGVPFPASVACMIVLFLALLLSQWLLGDKWTRTIVRYIDIPCGFSLRYINVFFTPSFILLPLSQSTSGIEIGKIIAVFLIGYFAVFVFTTFCVRLLQMLLGTSKRAITEDEDQPIPLEKTRETRSSTSEITLHSTSVDPEITDSKFDSVMDSIEKPRPAQDPFLVRGTLGPPTQNVVEASVTPPIAQEPHPLTRPQQWAPYLTANLDIMIYTLLFVFIGLPVYYATGYAMPAQLCLTVVAFFAALSLPAHWKRFLHPVLVSSAVSILAIWILALTRRESLDDGLHAFKTGTRYIELWHGYKNLPYPGAGDMFSTLLDVSIVALALPMFQYRKELKRHLLIIVLPLIPLIALSMFAYPAVCAAISLSPSHSLAFTARSLTLALATPTSTNFGGDSSLVAVLCIMSGILGILVGQPLLKWLGVRDDDYVTRGVTLGANSSAIATASLLTMDPRAAALSSLVMGLFGAVMVGLSSVPEIVEVVKKLAQT